MNLDLFVHLAQLMRQAIEALPCRERPVAMQSFPRGSCGDASLLLGAYLADCGYPDFVYINGERGSHNDNSWTSHAWLAKGRLSIDITADQFKDAPSPIIVDAPSLWHRQFKHRKKRPADFRQYHGPTIFELEAMYERMKPLLFPACLS